MAASDAAVIRSNSKLLLEVLGLEKTGAGQPCPCGSSDALSIYTRNSQWYFKCHSCGTQGSAIDALMIFKKLSQGEAFHECKERLGINTNGSTPHRQREPEPKAKPPEQKPESTQVFPDIIEDAAEKIIARSHEYLMSSDEVQRKWMIEKRGIAPEVAERYRLGFMEDGESAGWVLPITAPDGKILAIKRHLEIQPPPPAGEKPKGKGRWMKISRNEQNAVRAFWPHPYTQQTGGNPAFLSDGSSWLAKLPNGKLRDEWNEKLDNNKFLLASEVSGSHPDDFTTAQLEFCFRQTWDDLGSKIQEFVIKHNPAEFAAEDDSIDGWIFITPGELKALSLISSGMKATSFTHGETVIPTVEELRCFRGRRVVLFYDDDIPRQGHDGSIEATGKKWVSKMIPRLQAALALEVRVLSGGRK